MLINKSTLEKFDSQGMYKIYDIWPEIAEKSYLSDYKLTKFQNISHIVFAGMGGSGAISDIFYSILSKTGIHVDIVKGYLLPSITNSESLVIITSVSGNTIETLTILEEAKKIGCKILALSNGEEIEKGVLVIEKGIITKIGKYGEVVIDKRAHTTVNAKGKHVYPGFINVNNTLGLREIDE